MSNQKGFVHILVPLIIIVLLGAIGLTIFTKINNKDEKTNPSSRKIETVKQIEPQTTYENPFDSQTAYQNPFEEIKNPFDSL